MPMRILEQVLTQCRSALLGGVPIIYIKTDSDVFIRKLVSVEEDPLVVLLSNGGRKGSAKERDQKRWRPIYEMKNPQDKQLQFCANYCDALPKEEGGVYKALYRAPKDESLVGPVLWVYKMPAPGEVDPARAREIFEKLERYVVNHENPGHPQYAVLQSSVVLLYSSAVNLSPMLQTYTEFIDVNYPDEEEIRQLIKAESGGDPNLVENDKYLSALCTDFLGFTSEEIMMTMQRILAVSSLEKSREVETIISEHKRQKMQGGILEQCEAGGRIGGMKRFRSWLEQQIEPLKNANVYMRKIGTPPPKGVLLCGIPGCGKSEAARTTAHVLDLPLLKMDVGSLMDKYQGVSEQKMRDALKMAEAMAPCVLWIDELEKGFSGAGGSDDSASFKRMFGYMLGWMQDNKKPCFIFATANDIGGLPKEFFRSGRFDALYAVYLPTAEECVDIFRACMGRAEENVARARRISLQEVRLFGAGCEDEQLLRRVINETFVREDGRPRIVVGSDIQQIVTMCLREMVERTEPISAIEWENALRRTILSPSFSAYGDGEENVDSVAIGYCRMLRKGFIPTAEGELFHKEDYHVEFAPEYERLKRISTKAMSKEEEQNHQCALRQYEILQDRKPDFPDRYDRALYVYLHVRINEMALLLEKRERESLTVR